MSANACTKLTRPLAVRVMGVWSYLQDDPEFRGWDMEAQGDMCVRVARLLEGSAELTNRENVFRHFKSLED